MSLKKKQRRKAVRSGAKPVILDKVKHKDHEEKWKQQDVCTICVDRRGLFVVI